jgi:hypothetical protein
MKWEYHILALSGDRDDKSVQDALNGLGQGGWELVSHYDRDSSRCFVFRRPLQS